MKARYHDGLVNQGISAEMMAERWHLDRATIDAFSLESHSRAASATASGKLAQQILPVAVKNEDGSERLFASDEGVRPDTTLDKLAGLKSAFRAGGVITAGNSSQISDGAAALLLMERGTAARLGLVPRARFAGFALAGDDPVIMLSAPIPATKKVLARAGLALSDVDRVEINEAFASVVLAWEKETGADMSRVNVNGGAIAIGHPLGASGARLMTDLVYELERSGGRYGLQTMCEGGGMANATLIERLG
jgi:acetyl-CoA acyltransferase